MQFLIEHFPRVTKESWISRMEMGEVVDADGIHIKPNHPYRPRAMIFYYREVEDEMPIPFEEVILHQDEHLLVVDKPHFLPAIPAGRYLHETLLVRLKRKLQMEHLTPLHRLDRETAGVILFSTNPESRSSYASLFNNRQTVKEYEALAPLLKSQSLPLTYRSRIIKGEPFFRMEEVAGEPNTETHIELIELQKESARYRLQPITGKKHQLRVHLAALGIPIVNDHTYPELLPDKGDDYSHPLKLLAKSIAFSDPYTGKKRCFESGQSI
ncbi:MAG: pseudouridine synthase [Gammaproteobacteria bacterium]|nr:pseudouridine synthase [Gammaproteobacteria bacterium]